MILCAYIPRELVDVLMEDFGPRGWTPEQVHDDFKHFGLDIPRDGCGTCYVTTTQDRTPCA